MDSLQLIESLRVLKKHQKSIGLAMLLALLVSALGSWFLMDNYYLSTSVFFPVNQAATDRNALFKGDQLAGESGYYGSKHDANRVLTIANSRPIIEYVIEKYNLVNHYNIDTGRKFWRTKVKKEFEENYKAIKTEKDAIEISLLDTKPELAAEIVNEIVRKTDELNKKHIIDVKYRQMALLDSQINMYKTSISMYMDTMSSLGENYGIKVVVGADGNNVVLGSNYKAVEFFKTILKQQENAMRELNNISNIKDQIKVTIESNASSLFVLESAVPADKKEKPLRSIIVILAVAATFVLSVFFILISEQIRNIQKQL